MQKCPICACDNLLGSEYCERCGMPLKTSPAAGSDIEYTIPSMRMPLPPPPSTPPYTYLSTATPASTYIYQPPSNERERPPRTIGNTIFGVLLYLIGASSTALGIFGSLHSLIGDVWTRAYFLISALLVSIIVLIIILVRHRSTRWRWWQRLLAWVGTTIGMMILVVSGYILLDTLTKNNIPSVTSDLFLGSCFIIYGLLTMFLVLR